MGSTYVWGMGDVEVVATTEQTRWPANPQQPFFRITVHRRGELPETVDFSPEPWASNRRDLCGWSWPGRKMCGMNFADVVTATDLQTGEVLTRVGLWLSVLHHREDAPPWYVQWADQHLLVLCVVGFVRQELGQFRAAMRQQVNAALQGLGHAPLDDDGFKSIMQAARDGYNGCRSLGAQVRLLTDAERLACRRLVEPLLSAKGLDPAQAGKYFPA